MIQTRDCLGEFVEDDYLHCRSEHKGERAIACSFSCGKKFLLYCSRNKVRSKHMLTSSSTIFSLNELCYDRLTKIERFLLNVITIHLQHQLAEHSKSKQCVFKTFSTFKYVRVPDHLFWSYYTYSIQSNLEYNSEKRLSKFIAKVTLKLTLF